MTEEQRLRRKLRKTRRELRETQRPITVHDRISPRVLALLMEKNLRMDARSHADGRWEITIGP